MGGSWQPGRAGQHVAKSPGAPLAGCALDNLAFQLQHGDKQYVMRRVLYGKCSASGKHPDASMLGTCGSSCALEGQGGKHVDGIVYGVARPLHKEMRIGTKCVWASQSASAAFFRFLRAAQPSAVLCLSGEPLPVSTANHTLICALPRFGNMLHAG